MFAMSSIFKLVSLKTSSKTRSGPVEPVPISTTAWATIFLPSSRMTALEEEEPTSIPRVYTVFTFLYKKSIIKRVGIAAIDGSYGLDIFDEDAGVRAGTAEVDDDIVRSPDGFLFEHATRLLAFHNLTYLFDIIHSKAI